MLAIADDRGLLFCEFYDRPQRRQLMRIERICGGNPEEGPHDILEQTRRELDEYFLGQREDFAIPLVLEGRPFQSRVWRELLKIPFGKTMSYDSIARVLQKPGAARAVGQANGDNPIAIIVPCHRVIASNGTMAGYGGGRHRKRWLLAHERKGVQLLLDSGWE